MNEGQIRYMSEKKIFVLDTSVIIYDHEAIKSFDEHDVAIPITVLEELDNFKKGNDTKNFAARAFIRFLDSISKEQLVRDWVPLDGKNKGRFRVAIANGGLAQVEKVFGNGKADHQILGAALSLQKSERKNEVVFELPEDVMTELQQKKVEKLSKHRRATFLWWFFFYRKKQKTATWHKS